MKAIANAVLLLAVVSLILGIISRFIMIPIPIAPGGGVEASVFLQFANVCLLLAIALLLKGK
jgi:hypothetical protein